MLDEFEMLDSFLPTNLEAYKGEGEESKVHPYEIVLGINKSKVTYHYLPLRLLLRSLLFGDGRGEFLDFMALDIAERRERALDARLVLLSYLGVEEKESTPKKYYQKEAAEWRNGFLALSELIASRNKRDLCINEKSIASTIDSLNPKKNAVYDFSVASPSRDKPDFFSYDCLLSEAVIMGRLCRYGFHFKPHQLEEIFAFYDSIKDENGKQLGRATASRYFLCACYIYALQSRYKPWQYVEIRGERLAIVAYDPEFHKKIRDIDLADYTYEGASPIAQYPGEDTSGKKPWAYRFLGYEYNDEKTWGHDPENEVIIDYIRGNNMDEKRGVPEYAVEEEFEMYPMFGSFKRVGNLFSNFTKRK